MASHFSQFIQTGSKVAFLLRDFVFNEDIMKVAEIYQYILSFLRLIHPSDIGNYKQTYDILLLCEDDECCRKKK